MVLKWKSLALFITLMLVLQFCVLREVAAQEVTVDAQKMEQLERLIREQQQQLNNLQKQLNELKQVADEAQSQAVEAKSLASEGKTVERKAPERVVSSGEDKVKITISGQVNRAVNIADDGKSTRTYFVDSDASNSRVRLVGAAKINDDLTLGSRIEVAFAPNESSEVNQENEESGDFFDQRWTEVSLQSKRYGKLSLGKGSTASDDTAEVDLSRTGIVMYSSVADIAGGLLFRQKADDDLTAVTIADAFQNLDGLGRKSRVRYDTPMFYGFRLASSAVSDQRYDASLWWGGQGYGFKAAGAAAYANVNEDNSDDQYDGSFSILHESTGLNLTLAAGLKDVDDQDDPKSFYAKAGWLTRFFSFGETAFGVDYARSLNLPTENDDGYSFGAALVQQFEEYGTELYMQYRLYSLDRNEDPSVYDINVGTIGARVRF